MMNEWIISSSILIAAVLLGRFLLRGRISLRLQYGLWAVALIRLLLPVQIFTSDFSAGSIARDVDISAPVRQVYVSANEDRYAQAYDEAVRQVAAQHVGVSEFVELEAIENEAHDLARSFLELDFSKLLLHIWFGGMVVMAAVIISCNVHLSIQLKRRRWAMEVPDSLLPVYVTEAVPTPCIFGFFKPVIYLTPDAAGDPQVRAHVLAHELTHYRHLDHIWSVLRSFCLVLHWYNPLVWAAAKVSRADAELACDEGTLTRLGEEQRGDYGRTLIGLTCPSPVSDLLLTSTTMTGSAGAIRERIKLLMQRPRNTVLTVTAVILMVTLIVGCTFAGAPETTVPEETLPTPAVTAPEDTTEPTGHTPNNDMSYHGQDLPIPDDLSTADLLGDDGLLIFPGTEWGMTEAELLEALDIQEYGIFSGMRGILLADTSFCGYPASIAFYFDQYRNTDEWGLCDVTVHFEDEAAANAVYDILYKQLGDSDSRTSGITSCVWRSDSSLEDLVLPEAWAIYQGEHTTYLYDGQSEDHRAASSVAWFGEGIQGQENMVCFSSRLNLARQIEAALGMDTTSLHYALSMEQAMMEQAMAEYLDKNPRKLTAEEIDRVNEAFAHTVYDPETDSISVLPVAAFFTSYYDDVRELNFEEFLRYFPISGEATEEEFQLLLRKYGDDFLFSEFSSIAQMPVPVHRYETGHLDGAFRRYANLPFLEFQNRGSVYYLEETGCFYNFTSDFGPGMFPCVDGFVYDGGAILYSKSAALYLSESGGRYSIYAHLPILTAG